MTDAAALDAMTPEERTGHCGNFLYPHVCTLVGESLAGKITGMLLEMTSAELASLMVDYEALKTAVQDAVGALPPDMLDMLGEAPPSPATPGGPSPTSVMGPEASWGDCDDEADSPLPPINEMLAAAERKRASREGAGDVEAMDTDDGFVREWDAEAMAATEPGALCAFIADRLQEPQVRIMRAVQELLGAPTALQLLETTERCLYNGGMIVEETGKPRTPGGIYLKLLKDASDLPVEAQLAALTRIKKEGADAKKAAQKALNAKRSMPKNAKPVAEAPSPTERKHSLADFIRA